MDRYKLNSWEVARIGKEISLFAAMYRTAAVGQQWFYPLYILIQKLACDCLLVIHDYLSHDSAAVTLHLNSQATFDLLQRLQCIFLGYSGG